MTLVVVYYYNELNLGEAVESAYLMCKPEQYRLTPKYDILHSLVLLVKHYFVTAEEYDNPFNITCQHCNGLVTCSGKSG